MTWQDHMHREAVALAIPLWTWHDGDQVDVSCGIDPGSTMDDRDFYVTISVERPTANLRADRHMSGVEAAEFFNDLMDAESRAKPRVTVEILSRPSGPYCECGRRK